MRDDIRNPPLASRMSALKGLAAGGFMALGLFAPWDIAPRILFFIIGFIVLVDAVMPADRRLYAVTSMLFMIIGGIIGFFAAVAGQGLALLVVFLVIAIAAYARRVLGGMRPAAGRKGRKDMQKESSKSKAESADEGGDEGKDEKAKDGEEDEGEVEAVELDEEEPGQKEAQEPDYYDDSNEEYADREE